MPGKRSARAAAPLGALATLLALAACDDPVAPSWVGVYFLESVAGEALPALLVENEEFRIRVHSDELRLDADGTGRRITTGTLEWPPTGETESFSWETPLVHQVVLDRIAIDFPCRLDTFCVAPPHLVARRHSDGLEVRSFLGERDPLIYVPGFIQAGSPWAGAAAGVTKNSAPVRSGNRLR